MLGNPAQKSGQDEFSRNACQLDQDQIQRGSTRSRRTDGARLGPKAGDHQEQTRKSTPTKTNASREMTDLDPDQNQGITGRKAGKRRLNQDQIQGITGSTQTEKNAGGDRGRTVGIQKKATLHLRARMLRTECSIVAFASTDKHTPHRSSKTSLLRTLGER